MNSIAAYVPSEEPENSTSASSATAETSQASASQEPSPFAAALYSHRNTTRIHRQPKSGRPERQRMGHIQKHYVNMKHDFAAVGGYVSWENINMLMEMHKK